MKISMKFLIVAAIMGFAAAGVSHAQLAPKEAAKAKAASKAAQTTAAPATPPPTEAAPAAAPAQPGWTARCSSASRDTPLECAMEQTAVLSKTGQLIVLVNIRAQRHPHPGRVGATAAQVGRPGAKLQVDDGRTTDLQIQTCENRGCYATRQSRLNCWPYEIKKQLKVLFQNLAKETLPSCCR